MLRLQDVYAPSWHVTINGTRYDMKPLSLKTFAELEGEGISLSSLSGRSATQAWARMFYFLAGLPHDEETQKQALMGLLQDPIGLKKYQDRVLQAIDHQEDLKDKVVNKNKHGPQIKRPPKKKPDKQDPQDQQDQQDPRQERDEETEASPEPLDAVFLLTLSRLTGLSLADLSQMSFRGVMTILDWVKENPPQPMMNPMMGMMGLT